MQLRHVATHPGRLSDFLKEELGMSTGLINRRKWQNQIFVNGTPQFTNYPVQTGDVITVPLEDEAPEYPAEPGTLSILYEDAHILALEKPAGMLIHPSRAVMTGTLANRVLFYYRQTGQNCAFHPITRLDRDTFGIVLLAKNAHVHALLNALHSAGELQKTYHARVFGCPESDSGLIDAPIARRPLPSLLRYVNQEGKPSLTRYRVLEKDSQTALLELQPVTGRTHQLRVHCAHMGWPILGDPQYGSEASLEYSRQLGLSSQLLCAKKLTFTHPITAEQLHLESKMDAGVER